MEISITNHSETSEINFTWPVPKIVYKVEREITRQTGREGLGPTWWKLSRDTDANRIHKKQGQMRTKTVRRLVNQIFLFLESLLQQQSLATLNQHSNRMKLSKAQEQSMH